MNAPFDLRVTFEVECAHCSRPGEPVIEMRLQRGDRLPEPALPSGWCQLDGQPICDRHEIAIKERKENTPA